MMGIWVELKTDRLTLRAPRPSDAGPMTLYCQDARVATMTTSIPHPYLPEMAESFIKQIAAGRHREDVWVMDAPANASDSFVGVISYQPDRNSIAYWVGPPFWSTGYASEAVIALTDHLLGTCGLSEVQAQVFFDNPASQQVLRKAGFVETGTDWMHSVARGQEAPVMCFVRSAA